MITSAPTKQQLQHWRALWEEHRQNIKPDRRSGQQLVDYLCALYPVEETKERDILDMIAENVTANSFSAERLPDGILPAPRAFFIRNEGNGSLLYEGRSGVHAGVERILVGVDTVTGCYHVEGSDRLWDELCAWQGVDEADLANYVRTGVYLDCRACPTRMVGRAVTVTVDRPLGSSHPRHPEMTYPVNYGYVRDVMAPDGAWQDAYILGVDRPVESFSGRIIAVIVRSDDVEDKWVVAPEGASYTLEQIAAQVDFQEKFFHSQILM